MRMFNAVFGGDYSVQRHPCAGPKLASLDSAGSKDAEAQ